MNEEFSQGANVEEVADPQTEQTQETSVNSEVADPTPVQDAETNAHYAEQRRKQELEQYRSQVETYQQQLDRTARLSGYENHEQLLSALDEIEQQQERERYEQAGIDPEEFQQLVSQLPEIQQFRQLQQQQAETQQLQTEANELFAEFPNLTPEQIPPEAWQLKESRGLSLLDAYLRTTYKSLGQQKEQEAIQKLQGNAQSSPGTLGAGAEHQSQSVANMSKTDFETMIQRVKRGERVEL